MPDAAHDPREVPGTPFLVEDLERGHVFGRLRRLLQRRVGHDDGRARRGRDLAGDPEDREEVGAVRGDLDVQDRVVESERVLHVLTELELRRQDEDALVARGDPELHRRAEHPVRYDASDLPSGERLRQRRKGRARRGERNEIAGLHVANADDDLLLPRPGLDARDAEVVGVGVVTHLDDARHDDTREPLPRAVHGSDLGAPIREELGELLGRQVGRDELAQPGVDDLHATPSNCSRKRTSPSTNRRRSFTPYRTIATRSMPIPNANPV